MFAGFGGGGLYFILDGLVSRVFLAPERLVYRNFYGAKKVIPWRDIKRVSIRFTHDRSQREYLLVTEKKTKIKISRNYVAYDLLKVRYSVGGRDNGGSGGGGH